MTIREISDDYENVRKKFRMKNMKDYCDLCLKVDFLLLVDVFENFRNRFINSFELDAIHYLSAPGYSWDVMLRFICLVESNLRHPKVSIHWKHGKVGGISMISKGYSKANNKFLKLYDLAKHQHKSCT